MRPCPIHVGNVHRIQREKVRLVVTKLVLCLSCFVDGSSAVSKNCVQVRLFWGCVVFPFLFVLFLKGFTFQKKESNQSQAHWRSQTHIHINWWPSIGPWTIFFNPSYRGTQNQPLVPGCLVSSKGNGTWLKCISKSTQINENILEGVHHYVLLLNIKLRELRIYELKLCMEAGRYPCNSRHVFIYCPNRCL